MRLFSYITSILLVFTMISCSSAQKRNSPFSITETDQGLELKENGNPVFFYQKKPKTLTGQYVCSNYIHPLYNLNGDILTEEFPADHPFHRGVFWAWHQLYKNSIRLGDGWTNDSISLDVVKISSEKDNEKVMMLLDVLWSSSAVDNGKPFIDEKTKITVHKLESNIRRIDFEISLHAMTEGIQLGGSADQKGYGGFCVRMRLPDSLIFSSEGGPVAPQELQLEAGPWMDFSGKFGMGEGISGLTILCHSDMSDHARKWILRKKGSMQNAVFPGNQRIDIPVNKSIVLRYRLLIHDGNRGSIDIPREMEKYSGIKNN